MRRVRGALLTCAVIGIAAVSVLSGCTQFQNHDTLAALLTDQPATNSTTRSAKQAQEPNAVPREDNGRSHPPYIIEAPDALMIEVVVKDPKTGAKTPLPEQAITGTFVVQADGTVGLGIWGSVQGRLVLS